jgi:hypothetical protein
MDTNIIAGIILITLLLYSLLVIWAHRKQRKKDKEDFEEIMKNIKEKNAGWHDTCVRNLRVSPEIIKIRVEKIGGRERVETIKYLEEEN